MRVEFPSRRLAFATVLALTGLLSFSAGPAEAEDSRNNKFVLAADGSLLWVRDGVGGTSDGSDLVRRDGGGTDTTISEWDSCLVDCGGGTPLLQTGLGAFPDMNSNGAVAFKANISPTSDPDPNGCCDPEDHERSAMLMAPAGGAATVIARASMVEGADRTLIDADGDASADDGFCDFEPMPVINDAGQVAFGAYAALNNLDETDDADFDECSEENSVDELPSEWKGIFRWTSGSGISTFLRTNRITPADTVVVGAGESIPAGTYYATDVDLNNTMSKRSMNASGQILVKGNLDDAPSDSETCDGGTCYERTLHLDDRRALLLLTGTATRSFIAGTGPDTSSDPYQDLDDGLLNNAGHVLYKAEARTDNGDSAFQQCGLGPIDSDAFYPSTDCGLENADDEWLNLWIAGVTTTVAQHGDPVPGGSTAEFGGFTPFYGLNESGDVAFVSGLDLDAACDDVDYHGFSRTEGDVGNICQGVYLRSGGTTIEIARSTGADAADPSGGTSSSLDGFPFEMISGRVMLQENGTLFFMVENGDDPTGPGDCPLITSGSIDDEENDEQTMIVAWSQQSGLVSVLRENEVLPNGQRVIRIFAPEQPASNDLGQIFVKAQLGPTDGSCDVLAENQAFLQLAGPASSVLEIPTAGRTGLLVLALLLLSAAAVLFRRQKGMAQSAN